MNKLHFTLQPATNAILIILWGVLAAISYTKCSPHPILLTATGTLLGLVAGIMQTLTIREAQSSFLDATSMPEVLAAAKSTKWGKRHFNFELSSYALLFILGLVHLSPFLAVLSSYFAFMCVREIVTLKTVLELHRLSLKATKATQQKNEEVSS